MPKKSLNFLNKYKTLGLLNQELIKTNVQKNLSQRLNFVLPIW